MTRTSSAAISRPVSLSRIPRLALALSVATASVTLLAASASNAQAQTIPEPPPQIVISANGIVESTPDRANVQLGVETQAKTAAAASAENNRKQTAVLAAIKALGIPAGSITTSSFNVSPIQRWDEKERKTVIDGYRVSNLVVVKVAKVEQTGAVIDAALAAGANRVAQLNFELSDPSKAREEAITKAVAQARKEAEIAARAAGGRIQGLLEITVNPYEPPRPMPMYAMAKVANEAADATPISEGSLTTQVNVSTRWRFQPQN